MRMQRCPTGHFYDADNFPECPHCERLKAEGNWKNAVKDDLQPHQEIEQVEKNRDLNNVQPFQQEITVSYHQSEHFDDESQTLPPGIEIQSVQTPPSFLTNAEVLNHTNEIASEKKPEKNTLIIEPTVQQLEVSPPTHVEESFFVQDTDQRHTQTAVFAQSETEPFSYDEEKISPEAVQSNSSSEKTFRILQNESGKDPTVGWLVVLNGEHYGEDFRLRSDKNYIGRNEDMDIALTNEKSVSRNKHVIVSFEPRKQVFFVQPGESRKLFYLNEEVVLAPVFLKRNDVLTIGEVDLMFIPLCDEKFTWKKERK